MMQRLGRVNLAKGSEERDLQETLESLESGNGSIYNLSSDWTTSDSEVSDVDPQNTKSPTPPGKYSKLVRNKPNYNTYSFFQT